MPFIHQTILIWRVFPVTRFSEWQAKFVVLKRNSIAIDMLDSMQHSVTTLHVRYICVHVQLYMCVCESVSMKTKRTDNQMKRQQKVIIFNRTPFIGCI